VAHRHGAHAGTQPCNRCVGPAVAHLHATRFDKLHEAEEGLVNGIADSDAAVIPKQQGLALRPQVGNELPAYMVP